MNLSTSLGCPANLGQLGLPTFTPRPTPSLLTKVTFLRNGSRFKGNLVHRRASNRYADGDVLDERLCPALFISVPKSR